MKRLLAHFIFGFLGLCLAVLLVPGVKVEGDFYQALKVLLFAGLVLGLVNYFIKPIIKLITLPLRIITLGLFSLVINMGIIWFIDVFFLEFSINGLYPLFLTSLIISLLGIILKPLIERKIKKEN